MVKSGTNFGGLGGVFWCFLVWSVFENPSSSGLLVFGGGPWF